MGIFCETLIFEVFGCGNVTVLFNGIELNGIYYEELKAPKITSEIFCSNASFKNCEAVNQKTSTNIFVSSFMQEISSSNQKTPSHLCSYLMLQVKWGTSIQSPTSKSLSSHAHGCFLLHMDIFQNCGSVRTKEFLHEMAHCKVCGFLNFLFFE